MYINKVVFVEWEDLKGLNEEIKRALVFHTDYGTDEILAGTIQDMEQAMKEDSSLWSFSYSTFKEEVANALGEDLYKLLESGEVDFCLVV